MRRNQISRPSMVGRTMSTLYNSESRCSALAGEYSEPARFSRCLRVTSKWEAEDHFVSWLRLCPDNRISGDKIIGKGRLPTKNRVSIALKMAASTLRRSNTYLGAQFRRFRTKLGSPIAIKAMAAKLARLVYRMLRYGMKYVDQGAKFYETQHRILQIKQLKWKAAKLGFQVVQAPAA
jgi:transposase